MDFITDRTNWLPMACFFIIVTLFLFILFDKDLRRNIFLTDGEVTVGKYLKELSIKGITFAVFFILALALLAASHFYSPEIDDILNIDPSSGWVAVTSNGELIPVNINTGNISKTMPENIDDLNKSLRNIHYQLKEDEDNQRLILLKDTTEFGYINNHTVKNLGFHRGDKAQRATMADTVIFADIDLNKGRFRKDLSKSRNYERYPFEIKVEISFHGVRWYVKDKESEIETLKSSFNAGNDPTSRFSFIWSDHDNHYYINVFNSRLSRVEPGIAEFEIKKFDTSGFE